MNRRSFLKVVGATAAVIAVNPSSISQTLYASICFNVNTAKSNENLKIA